MIKNPKFVYGLVAVFVLFIFVFFIRNNYQKPDQKMPEKPIELSPKDSKNCGIEQCHGIDVTCGSNIPEMCTMEMRIEDNCRKYLRCEKVGRKCSLIKEAKFEPCKICIQKCNQEKDSQKAFQCANMCLD